MALRHIHDRTLGLIYLLVVPLLIILVGIGGVVEHAQRNTKTTQLAREGAEAHRAICVLRTDLSQRINESRAFLRGNPRGVDGFSAQTIRASIISQQQTVDALNVITCP